MDDWPVFAAQDALVAAIKAARDSAHGTASVSLGYPTVLDDDHIWVTGSIDGDFEDGLSNAEEPTDGRFDLQVRALTHLQVDEWGDVRDRVKAFVVWIRTAVVSAAFRATVSKAHVASYKVLEGVDDDGSRQAGAEITVSCSTWSE